MIPTAGKSEFLERTLTSLGDCQLPGNFAGTMVVENGERGNAKSITETAPGCLHAKYIHCEKKNKSSALNFAIEPLSDDCFIYLTDDDIRFQPDVLSRFESQLNNRSSGVVLGGPLGIDCESEPPESLSTYLPPSMTGWFPTPDQLKEKRLMFLGANWGVFAGDIKRAGGFDPRFGPGSPLNATGQEWTMQKRLHELGMQFEFVEDATVWHKVDSSRFSLDFITNRAYRMGVESGISLAIRPRRNLKNWLGVLWRLSKTCWSLLSNTIRSIWIKQDKSDYLDMAISIQRAKGFFKGFCKSWGQRQINGVDST